MIFLDIQNDEELAVFSEIVRDEVRDSDTIELIKTANVDEDLSGLIDEGFADSQNRMFPIHTAADTAISALYINSQQETVPDIVKTACQNALNDWGIETISIKKGLKKEAQSRISSPEDVFLLPSRKKLPATDKDMLLKSASVLTSHLNSLDIPTKVSSAMQLKKFSMEYGVDMRTFDPVFNRYSLSGNCDLGKLAGDITDRISGLQEDDQEGYRSLLSKMADFKKDNGGNPVVTDKEITTGIAYELLELDKQAGLFGTFDPILDTFNVVSYDTNRGGLSKIANDTTEVEEISVGGYQIPLVKIASIDEELANNIFGDINPNIVVDGAIDVDRLEDTLSDLSVEAGNVIARRINRA